MRISQFLGKISLAVYLTHIPVRRYFQHYQNMNIAHIETIRNVTVATLVLSIVLTYVIEEPIKKLLRK